MGRQRTELRVEVDADEVSVLDGYCHAHGQDRTTVLRALLREWSEKQLHVATVICRVARRNPGGPEPGRGNPA